jgi:hypothetical protein
MAKNNTTKYLLIGGAVYAAFILFRNSKQIKGIGNLKSDIDTNYLTKGINEIFDLGMYYKNNGKDSYDAGLSDAYLQSLNKLFKPSLIKEALSKAYYAEQRKKNK